MFFFKMNDIFLKFLNYDIILIIIKTRKFITQIIIFLILTILKLKKYITNNNIFYINNNNKLTQI